MLQKHASSDPYESADCNVQNKPDTVTPKPVLVVLPGTLSGASTTVVNRAAHLAAERGGDLNVHIIRQNDASSIRTYNLRAFSKALRTAEWIVTSKHLKTSSFGNNDIASHVRTTSTEMRPACVFVAKDIGSDDEIHSSSLLNQIIESCDSPLWLVEPKAGSRRPIVLAAIEAIGSYDRQGSLNRTVLFDAAYLAKLYGAELHVMHSVFEFDTERSYLEKLQQSRRAQIQEWSNELGISVQRLHIPIGLPDRRLVEFAETQKPHVVVLGSEHRTTWQRFFDYNVTTQLVESCPSDLLIVHANSAPILVPGS